MASSSLPAAARANQSSPLVVPFFHKPSWTFTYIIADEKSSECAILDPCVDYDTISGRISPKPLDDIIKFIKSEGLNAKWLLDTHVHADHLSGLEYLKKELPNSKTAIGEHVKVVQKRVNKFFNPVRLDHDGSQFDHLLADEQEIKIGEQTIQVLHTPGHTPDSISYKVKDCLFAGDTMFMPDVGTARCDFPGGSAEQLYDTVVKKFFTLSPNTTMFVCHDYPPQYRENELPLYSTTIAEQMEKNIHLNRNTTKEEFIKFRKSRDDGLDLPKLMLPSLQINAIAGKMPEPELDGKSYIKFPINFF
ncbi:beta-lactamase domain-containing protein [Basidiobolus meristosporus CBS 931.73]|uniref:Beta-lactamase domain-containing protein n=1 Tax=Basidiobolus meristosporus CBS 931.73 TaxID=1314790 RepID=A0A1Y1YQT3_9FUNG|nr:beta-lactamase domain-containing protein [Basidiobolus meristosporus CBS 931.73]|eukprot:ORY00339.1 beta-lactamase domain-containing protein [Basidiobolus meristosporus CBS 931.73]